jgi:hypothetical protein
MGVKDPVFFCESAERAYSHFNIDYMLAMFQTTSLFSCRDRAHKPSICMYYSKQSNGVSDGQILRFDYRLTRVKHSGCG